MIDNIKKTYVYIFGKYEKFWEDEIKKVLTKKELELYKNMSRYDKIHSYKLYKLVREDEILKDKLSYQKLALLHDCGKGRVGLCRRIKKTLWGDTLLDVHPQISYELLEGIGSIVSELAKNHHNKIVDIHMKRFQELDDRA